MLLYTNRDKIKSDAHRNRFCEIVFDLRVSARQYNDKYRLEQAFLN